MKSAVRVLTTLLSAGVFLASCAPSESSSGGTGGAPASSTGGATATGGSGTGGQTQPSTGGAPGTGGAPATTGGASGTGGATGTGGNPSSTGGSPGATGGASGTGGRAGGSGGRMGSGGTTGTGGGTAGMTGTAGNSGGGFAPVAAIMGMSCGTGQCHQGGAHTDLRNNAGLYARLVGAMPVGTMVEAACRTRTLVVAGNLTMSVVSNIIKAGGVTGCGPRMPNMCSATGTNPRPCLTTAQIATIDAWISAGAPM